MIEGTVHRGGRSQICGRICGLLGYSDPLPEQFVYRLVVRLPKTYVLQVKIQYVQQWTIYTKHTKVLVEPANRQGAQGS
jgi:hypothetical protein